MTRTKNLLYNKKTKKRVGSFEYLIDSQGKQSDEIYISSGDIKIRKKFIKKIKEFLNENNLIVVSKHLSKRKHNYYKNPRNTRFFDIYIKRLVNNKLDFKKLK